MHPGTGPSVRAAASTTRPPARCAERDGVSARAPARRGCRRAAACERTRLRGRPDVRRQRQCVAPRDTGAAANPMATPCRNRCRVGHGLAPRPAAPATACATTRTCDERRAAVQLHHAQVRRRHRRRHVQLMAADGRSATAPQRRLPRTGVAWCQRRRQAGLRPNGPLSAAFPLDASAASAPTCLASDCAVDAMTRNPDGPHRRQLPPAAPAGRGWHGAS